MQVIQDASFSLSLPLSNNHKVQLSLPPKWLSSLSNFSHLQNHNPCRGQINLMHIAITPFQNAIVITFYTRFFLVFSKMQSSNPLMWFTMPMPPESLIYCCPTTSSFCICVFLKYYSLYLPLGYFLLITQSRNRSWVSLYLVWWSVHDTY